MSNTRPSVKSWKILLCCAALILAAGAVAAEESERYLVRYELGAKEAVLAALDPAAVIHHEFDSIGVIAVTLPPAEAQALSALGSVTDVSPDPIYQLFAQQVPYGIDMVNARDAWDADRDGAIDAGAATGDGIRVCIVDTGIAADHEDLGGGGVNILAGRSWVDEPWDDDRQGHGTHVAGTVAAMNNQAGVVGVSPGTVELIIADVFNDNGDGQASSTILDAANWCADQGADIISMSLGGPIGSLADGYQALYDRGILIVAAAGNDGGPVLNYPASYDAAVSVAAIDSTETVASFSNFVPQVEVAAPGVSVLSTYPFANQLAVDGGPEYAANSMTNADTPGTTTGPLADGGDCNVAPAPGAYSGQVVLCERGGATFGVKIDNAAAGGAVAAVIYNNAPGNFSGTYGNVCCSPIPAISLSQADGQDALSHLGTSASVVVEQVGSGYAELSGTSMATPHASATAAVIWSACPELDNDQIRSHLAASTRESTADLVAGRDIFYGHGIVQVKEGVDALRDGVDQYDPGTGNGDGSNPSNVECPTPEEEPEDGDKATGGGWLEGTSGKINFGFNAVQTSSGTNGNLQLNDHGQKVKIHIPQVTALSQLTSDCGSISAGANAVEFSGNGTFDGQAASFRVCVADHGEPGRGSDQFYLECTSGCAYDTASAASDEVIDGGNIQVHTTSQATPTSSGLASTLILDPLTLDEGPAGVSQVFTVHAFDAAQSPLAGATVTVLQSTAGGSVSFDAVTGTDGSAVVVLALPAGPSEYQAVAGSAESNTVAVDGVSP